MTHEMTKHGPLVCLISARSSRVQYGLFIRPVSRHEGASACRGLANSCLVHGTRTAHGDQLTGFIDL